MVGEKASKMEFYLADESVVPKAALMVVLMAFLKAVSLVVVRVVETVGLTDCATVVWMALWME